jgi:3-oxoacyl-[acyl-carrier protein] reductase
VTGAPRLVVVTGGGKGIGRAVVARFAAAGDRVLAVGRDRAALEGSGASAAEICDVTDEAQVAAFFERLERVDVLVNNAGVSTSAPLGRTTLKDWDSLLAVNATGAFLCTRAVVPGMKQRAHGRIVNISSGAGRSVSLTGIQAYASAKAGQLGLTRQTAHELGRFGITVNAIAPGFFVTNIGGGHAHNPDLQAAISREIPMHRVGQPDDIKALALFLSSPASAYITGQQILIDGGWGLGRAD